MGDILLVVEPAVFLDRDNTLIENDEDLGDPDGVRLCHGVADGLVALRRAGYRLVVVTNQGGVARGKYSEADVDAVHQRIACLIDESADGVNLIDRFYYCPFHPEASVEAYRREHPWRKPNPGMLIQAASDMQLDLGQSWMIGDQARDVAAGQSAGCRTALLGDADASTQEMHPTVAVETFSEAVHHILKHTPPAPDDTTDVSAEARNPATPDQGFSARALPEDTEVSHLRRALGDLLDELRSERMRRAEFTPLKMGAGVFQLLVVLLALLGLLEIGESDAFVKWFAGAGLLQLLTITLLLLDMKG